MQIKKMKIKNENALLPVLSFNTVILLNSMKFARPTDINFHLN